jgi:hypothetical protein
MDDDFFVQTCDWKLPYPKNIDRTSIHVGLVISVSGLQIFELISVVQEEVGMKEWRTMRTVGLHLQVGK